MMTIDVISHVAINLEKYGGTGFLEMEVPSVRKMIQMKNRIKDADAGDIELMSVVTYFKEAPFELTPAGFLDYCDELDRVSRGNGIRLYTEVLKSTKALDNGDVSPLEASGTAETMNSA